MSVIIHRAYGTLKIDEEGPYGNMKLSSEEEPDDDYVFTQEELTDNVGKIEVTSWGDSPSSCYIVVEGMTEDAVKSHWETAADLSGFQTPDRLQRKTLQKSLRKWQK